jgi:hypothetical protein
LHLLKFSDKTKSKSSGPSTTIEENVAMDVDLRRLIREHYPLPIAHAHKKTLACLDDDAHKLKCLLQAAESAVQFLALGSRGLQLRDDLRNPTFGK